MANNCYVKKGIRELDISDQLKHQLNKLFMNESQKEILVTPGTIKFVNTIKKTTSSSKTNQ